MKQITISNLEVFSPVTQRHFRSAIVCPNCPSWIKLVYLQATMHRGWRPLLLTETETLRLTLHAAPLGNSWIVTTEDGSQLWKTDNANETFVAVENPFFSDGCPWFSPRIWEFTFDPSPFQPGRHCHSWHLNWPTCQEHAPKCWRSKGLMTCFWLVHWEPREKSGVRWLIPRPLGNPQVVANFTRTDPIGSVKDRLRLAEVDEMRQTCGRYLVNIIY